MLISHISIIVNKADSATSQDLEINAPKYKMERGKHQRLHSFEVEKSAESWCLEFFDNFVAMKIVAVLNPYFPTQWRI